jgi:hypothetical protein
MRWCVFCARSKRKVLLIGSAETVGEECRQLDGCATSQHRHREASGGKIRIAPKWRQSTGQADSACSESLMRVAQENGRRIRSRSEPSVSVECLTCGHIGVLTREALSRFSIAPNTPIAAFVKRLRCRRCGSQSVLATRKPQNQKASWAQNPNRLLQKPTGWLADGGRAPSSSCSRDRTAREILIRSNLLALIGYHYQPLPFVPANVRFLAGFFGALPILFRAWHAS